MCDSRDCVFVFLWLDHYLRQQGGCGPTGATWLGGVATYTTVRDWCIEVVIHPSVTIARCLYLMFRVPEYDFLLFMLSLGCLDIMFR